jgi:cellulose synthase/poly-beta-1,6-N-acetylglucosamine synthase-like glycosyltransferase
MPGMSSPIAVSVIIPVFDRAAVLHAVLRHFEYQDFPKDRFEVIVVDDGSAEGIGRALAARSFRLQLDVIVQRNRGRASARNTGIQRARGGLIIFCDADRIPDPAFVSTHAAFHERNPGAAAVGVPWDCFLSFETIRQGGAELMPTIRKFSRQPAYYNLMCRLLPAADSLSPIAWAGFLVGNSSVRRCDVLQAGGFDEELTTWGLEHFELALRLMRQQGTAVRYLHGGGNYHVPHARDPDYFRAGIQEGVEVLAGKPSGGPIALLRSFMFGALSLQEFERGYCGRISERIVTAEPIFFRQLAPVDDMKR